MTNEDMVDFGVIVEGDGGWYWRAMSNNGRKVAIGGEPFTQKSNAVAAFRNLFGNLVPVFDDGSSELEAHHREVHDGRG